MLFSISLIQKLWLFFCHFNYRAGSSGICGKSGRLQILYGGWGILHGGGFLLDIRADSRKTAVKYTTPGRYNRIILFKAQ